MLFVQPCNYTRSSENCSVCGGLCPWCTSKRSLWHVFVDARMPHNETKIGISYGFQMFSIVSSLGAVHIYVCRFSYVIIHSLCSFKVTCIHASNISSIACSDIFVAVSSCNSGVWTKWGLWGQSSLSGLAHSDEIAEAWRAGADTAMMLFIERSGDVYWYLLVPLLCWFLHHDLSDGRRIAKREGIEYRYLQTCSVNPGPSRRWLQMRISMVGCIDCWRRTEIESDCVREPGSCTLFTISKSDKCCWRGISIFSSNIRFYSNLWWLSTPVKRVP